MSLQANIFDVFNLLHLLSMYLYCHFHQKCQQDIGSSSKVPEETITFDPVLISKIFGHFQLAPPNMLVVQGARAHEVISWGWVCVDLEGGDMIKVLWDWRVKFFGCGSTLRV
jgi:hypothetical protein